MSSDGHAVFAPQTVPTLAGDCCHVFSSEVERTFSHFFHMEFCMDAKRKNGLDVHIWFAYSEDLTKAAPMLPQAIEIRSEIKSKIRSESRLNQSPAATFPSHRSSRATQVVRKDLFFWKDLCCRLLFGRSRHSDGFFLVALPSSRTILSSRESGSPAASTRQLSSRAASC